MFRPLSAFVGWRYVGARRRSQLVSFISLVSIAGLVLGVALLITVLSVMNGFDRELRERILAVVPQATLNGYQPIRHWQRLVDEVERHPEVTAAAPFVHLQAMVNYRGEVQAALVYSIEPALEERASVVGRYLESGVRLTALEPGAHRILLGANLASALGVRAGESVTLIVPDATGASATAAPKLERFVVAGILRSGTELDNHLALIHLQEGARLAGYGEGVQGVRIAVSDLFQAPRVVRELVETLPEGFTARDWTRTHGNIYQAVQMSKRMVALLLFIIIAVAAFNVVSTLIMVVIDKQGDIAILRTLGASPGLIQRVFMVQGTLIGLIGTTGGVLLGLLLAANVSRAVDGLERLFSVKFLKADVYPVSYLPSDIRWEDVLLVAGVAFAMSFLATIYPAHRAARVQPAEALRYD